MSDDTDTENAIEGDPTVCTCASVGRSDEATGSSTSRGRTLRVAVPPIRSLSIREPILFNGSTNLRHEVNRSRDDLDIPNSSQQDHTATITHAINHLESLLEEVGGLAHLVEAPEYEKRKSQISRSSPSRKKRRPSDEIVSRGAKYLDSANPKRQTTLHVGDGVKPERKGTNIVPDRSVAPDGVNAGPGPVHRENDGTKSTLAGSAISEASPKPAVEFHHGRDDGEHRSNSTNDLQAVDPKSIDPFRRPSSHATLKQEIKEYAQKHVGVPVSGCTKSISSEPGEAGLGLPPALKLNSDDLADDPAESKPKQDYDADPIAEGFGLPRKGHTGHFTQMFGVGSREATINMAHKRSAAGTKISLWRKTHVDVFNKPGNFEVHNSCSHKPVARDWPTSRKRFTAIIVCVNTAFLGLLIGIYAGEVPAIQYVIADFGHWTILGNVCLYCGLAISTLIFWPLPLLHGRKPYTLAGLALIFALQIPQGVVVMEWRSTDGVMWRLILLLCRALSGFAFGFVTINLQASLFDVFGASLQSRHPHGELVDPYDVRRHGGGMGLWLGAWSWCMIGPISIGFMIGAFIIDTVGVSWGFWTALFFTTFVLLLNLIAPETRRSAFRRTTAEMTGASGSFSRVTRGEVKMHLKKVGPFWWGEEVLAGLEMSWLMVKQPGFLILAVYSAWVYAQFTLTMMMMGALTSRLYRYRPIWVGLCGLSLGAGAILAVPFQKASFFSRSRKEKFRTDSMTFQRSGFWSSHAIRRVLFTTMTPLAAIGFTCTTWGPPFPPAVPCVLVALVGYFSTLAMAECYGLVMEAFDTSDLQPGMTGRPNRKSVVNQSRGQRTNFTCHPRVSAGTAVMQSLKYALAAVATGVGGRVERSLGIMQASGVVAGILLVLTLLLTLVLVRFRSVRVMPMTPKFTDPTDRRATRWEPVILGYPSGVTRKMSLFESGRQTRWSEIRRRNRVNTGLTGS